MKNKVLEKFSVENKVAIVTGGAGLLGSQFVSTLLKENANVVAIDKNSQKLKELLRSHNEKYKNKFLAIDGDISNIEQVKHIVKKVVNKWGKIDILINSAAVDPKFDKSNEDSNNFSFENYPLENWNRSVKVNLTAVFLITQQVVKNMLKHHSGSIINISSTYGLVSPNQSLYLKKDEIEQKHFKPVCYAVTKGGILQFTRYLSTYYGKKNIRVNSLSPGGILNEQSEEFISNYDSLVPMGRMANLDELNSAILFLASDASSYMTGANLVIDGGWTSW